MKAARRTIRPNILVIRQHSIRCKANIKFDIFKILFSSNSKQSLLIAKSLFIKQLAPNLNSDQVFLALYI